MRCPAGELELLVLGEAGQEDGDETVLCADVS
jgi:hypothetical protein